MAKTGVNKGAATAQGGEITRRELVKKLSPLGSVKLDTAGCSLCGLCASECPTGALTMTVAAETGACRLLFEHKACDVCDRCREICPEQCLTVERTLETNRIGGGPVVLLEDSMVYCRACGRPLGTRVFINLIIGRMSRDGHVPGEAVELCPECKISPGLGGVRD